MKILKYKLNPKLKMVLVVAAVVFFCMCKFALAAEAESPVSVGSMELPSSISVEKEDDLTAGMFSQLFGIGWQAVAGTNTALGGMGRFSGLLPEMLGLANLVGFALCAIIAIFTTVTMTSNAAYDGKSLFGREGKLGLWWPIRTAYSFGATTPVVGGLSMINLIVIACVALSINFANRAWDYGSSYIVEHVDGGITDSAPMPIQNDSLEAIEPLFHAVLTQEIFRGYSYREYPRKDIVPQKNYPTGNLEPHQYYVSEIQGDYLVEHRPVEGRLIVWFLPPQDMPLGSLGAVSIPAPKLQVKEGKVQSPEDPITYNALYAIASARAVAVMQMAERLREHALYFATHKENLFSSDGVRIPTTTGIQIADEFREYVMAKAEPHIKTLSERSGLKEELSNALGIKNGSVQGGWAGAGIFTFVLSSAIEKIDAFNYGGGIQYSLIRGRVPEGITEKPDDTPTNRFLTYVGFYKEANMLPKQAVAALHKAPNYASDLVGARVYTGHGQDGDIPGFINRAITRVMYSGSIHNSGILSTTLSDFSSGNPISAMVAFGDRLLDIGLICGGVSVVGGGIGMIPGLGAVNEIINNPLMLGFMGICIIVGAVFAYVVPIYILWVWISALLSWAKNVVSAMFAGPLWAASHAMPEGEGFAGRHARKGYVMLVEILITPFLLVVCLCASYVMTQGMARLITTLFAQWANAASRYLELSVLYELVLAAAFVMLIFYAYKRLGMDFLLKVPGQVITWIGGIGMSLGGSENISTDVNNTLVGGVGRGGNVAGGLGASLGAHQSRGGGGDDEKPKDKPVTGGGSTPTIAKLEDDKQ